MISIELKKFLFLIRYHINHTHTFIPLSIITFTFLITKLTFILDINNQI